MDFKEMADKFCYFQINEDSFIGRRLSTLGEAED